MSVLVFLNNILSLACFFRLKGAGFFCQIKIGLNNNLMKHLYIFIIAFLFIDLSGIKAQENLFSNNMIGLKTGIGKSPALNFSHAPYINSQGAVTDYGVSSSPSYFFHSELTYARQVFPRFFVKTGLVYGYEAYNVRLNAGRDFIRTDEEVFPVEFSESDMEHRGLLLRALYQHPITNKSGLFGSGGATITKYIRPTTHSLFKSTVDNEEVVIFFMRPYVGTRPTVNRRFGKFDFELGYYYHLLPDLQIRGSISHSISHRDAIPASWFRFDGRRDIISGQVSRKMSQTALNVGLNYTFPRGKRELKSSSLFFQETANNLFGKRELGHKKNSISFTHEIVNNAQMKVKNQFVLDFNLEESDNGIFPKNNNFKHFTSVNYIRQLTPKSGIGIEFFTGNYRMGYDVVLKEDLIQSTFLETVFYFEKDKKTRMLGLLLFYRHNFNLSNRSSLFVSGGGGLLTTTKGIGDARSRGNRTFGSTQHLWEREIFLHQGKNYKPVVMANTGYSYRFSERFTLNTSFFFRYSNLSTHESTSYYLLRNVFTDEEILLHEGEYSLKFRHYGLQLGLQYNFGKDF